MKLIILTAVLAVCGAARLDRSYVPSLSSRTAAGSSNTLTSLEGSSRDGLPTGGYTNDALGVVVDAAAPGTRTAGAEPTGLGGPRTSYGSTDSKVGDAAFRVSLPGLGGSSGANTRIAPGLETVTGEKASTGGSSTRIAPGFESILAYGSDNDKAHANTLKFSNEIGLDKYSYGFETDNGIAVGANGVSKDGVKANGGYSYKGDDGKVYSVSYTADKNGYKPQGSHFPTPPPIPKEILVSLEKNAKEEAAGVVDDGSYDAQKYKDEGDYTSNNAGININGPATSSGGASIGTSFVSHSNQANTPVSPGNSAYSSAVTTGAGSASAYAGTGPIHTDLKNQFTNTYGFNQHGASGSSVSVPSSATASASVSGKQPIGPNNFPTRFGQNQNSFGQVSGASVGQASEANVGQTIGANVQSQTQSGSINSFGTGQSSAAPTNVPATGLSTPLESSVLPDAGKPSVSGFNSLSSSSNTNPSPTQPSLSSSQTGSASQFQTGQYKPQTSQSSFGQTANFATNSVKPTHSTLGGSSSYLYNQPLKPFVASEYHVSKLPSNQAIGSSTTVNSGQYSHNRQPNVPVVSVYKPGYSNAPVVTTVSPIASTHFKQYQGTTASSHNGLTQAAVSPFSSSNFGPISSQAQIGSSGSQQAVTQVVQKPIVQSQSGNIQTDKTQIQSQQGTIYEYNKPTSVSQQTATQVGQNLVAQTQLGQSQTDNTQSQPQQGTIYEYNKPASVNQQTVTQFGSKPIVQSQTDNTQTQPQQGTIYQYNKPTSVNQQTVSQIGQKPTVQSQSGYGQSQAQLQQGTIYEYNKPTSYKETTSTVEQVTSSQAPFVSQSTQFGNQASNAFSSTSGQHSTVQQTQNQGTVFGSQPVAQSGQKGSDSTSFTQTQISQKPFAGSQTSSNFQQSQFGTQGQNSGAQQNQGTIYEYNKPVNALSHKDSNSASSVEGTSSQSGVVEVQNTQSSNKPIAASQTISTFEPSKYDSQQASLSAEKVTETEFGKQPSGALPTSIPTRFGEKPSSSFGSTSQGQTSQYGQQVLGSSQTGSNFQQTQFGSSFGQKPFTQTQTTFGQKPVSTSQTGYNIQQTVFGASGSKYGQKPQSIFTSGTSSKGQSTQFGQQSFSSQFGNTVGSQFGHNTQNVQNTGLTTGTVSQTTTSKPVGSSQTGTYFQQIGQTPQTNQGSSPSKGQSTQTSQFGQTQYGGSGFTQSQYGSSTGTKLQSGFGTAYTTTPKVQPFTHYSTKPFGSQFYQNTFQQTPTTGYQFGQRLPWSAGTVYTSQVQPNYQYTKKPFGSQFTQNTFQKTQFGSTTGSQVGQKNQAASQTTSFGQKPAGGSFGVNTFSSTTPAPLFQGTQFGSASPSQPNTGSSFSIETTQSGVKPVGSSQTFGFGNSQTQYGSSQNSQNTQSGLETVSTATPQVIPISQYGSKPSTQYGSIGSRFGQSQSTTGTVPVITTSFVQKPVGVSQTATGVEQTQVGSSSSSVTPIKGQSLQTTQTDVKPFVSSQTSGSAFPQTQFGAFGVQKGQNSQSGVNAFSTTAQAPQNQGAQFGFSLGSQGNKGSSFSVGTTQSGVKPVGSSQTFGFGNSQTQYGSSQNSQNTQSGFGTVSTVTPQVIPISQYGLKPSAQYSSIGSKFSQSQSTIGTVPVITTSFVQKPVGVSQTATGVEQTQVGSSSSFVTPIKGQSVQTTQTDVKPFVSSQTSGSAFPQTQFGAFGVQKGQNSQSGVTTFSTTAQAPQYQGAQFGSSLGSQGNKGSSFSIGTTQSGVKPVGSTHTSGFGYSQTQYGSSQNSQNTQSGLGTVSTVTPQVIPISQFGLKPSAQYGSIGSRFGQSQATTGTVPVTTTSFVQKPVGISQTATGVEQTQVGSSSSSVTPIKDQSVQTTQTDVKPFVSSQTSGSAFPQTQFGDFGVQKGQNSQSGVTAFSTTAQAPQYQEAQFGSYLGSQGNKGSSFSIGTTQSGVKPVGSTHTSGFGYSQTQYGSSQNSQNTQSGLGTVSTVTPQVIPISQFGLKPSAQYGSIGSRFGQSQATTETVPVTTTSFVQKPVGISQTATGVEQTQVGSSSSSVTPIKDQSVQTTQTDVKPFVSSQTSGSSFPQTQFGDFGVQKGQISQSGLNAFSTTAQSPQFQGTQFGSSLGSQAANKGSSFAFGTVSKGQSTQSGIKPFGSGLQSQYGSSFGSHNSQNTQLGEGAISTSQVIPISPSSLQATQTQYGSSQIGQSQQTVDTAPLTTTTLVEQPVGTSQSGSGYQQTQTGSFSSSSLANAGTLTNQGNEGQVVQTTQYGLKPSQNSGSSSTQTEFGSLDTQKVQNQQTDVGTFPTTTQSPQNQGSQFGVSTGSQSGQTQFNQKPFGSTQNTGSNFQSGSQFGSYFNAKPQATFGTQSSFGQGFQSQFGSLIKKPYSSPFNTQFGVFGQKPQASASAFASSSPSFGGSQFGQVSKYQTSQFGTSGTQAANSLGGFQAAQGQTTQTSSQFGVQPQKPFGTSQFTYQKPVGSQSTFQYGQTTPSKVSSFSVIPSKEQNAFSTVSRFGELSKIEDQHTYQSTIAPLEYSTTFASTERYGSSTPTSVVTTPQAYYYSTPLSVARTDSTTPLSFLSTTKYGSNQVTSKPDVTVSTVPTSTSGVLINNQPSGFVEKFPGLRNPPSFNHVTGYHY